MKTCKEEGLEEDPAKDGLQRGKKTLEVEDWKV